MHFKKIFEITFKHFLSTLQVGLLRLFFFLLISQYQILNILKISLTLDIKSAISLLICQNYVSHTLLAKSTLLLKYGTLKSEHSDWNPPHQQQLHSAATRAPRDESKCARGDLSIYYSQFWSGKDAVFPRLIGYYFWARYDTQCTLSISMAIISFYYVRLLWSLQLHSSY